MKYTLPPIKKSKSNAGNTPITSSPDEYSRRVTIPANEEMLEELGIDDTCEVTLKGKITALNKHISPDYKNLDFSIEITSVKTSTAMKEKADGEYEDGYKRGKK